MHEGWGVDCQSTAPAGMSATWPTSALPVVSGIRSAPPPLCFPRSFTFDRLPGVTAVAHSPLGVIMILALWAIPIPWLHI